MDDYTDWTLIRLVGERASEGKSQEIQRKNAAMYLHYLLLARPDFLIAQGLLITMRSVMFLVGTGGIGIRQLKVNWEDKDLHKFIYAFIYHLYEPSHFADPSYVRTRFNKETSDDIASSSAPEVTSSYVTTWVRVGVNRARACTIQVVSSMFHSVPLFPSSSGRCIPPASLSFFTLPYDSGSFCNAS
jgi:hypothetical protein